MCSVFANFAGTATNTPKRIRPRSRRYSLSVLKTPLPPPTSTMLQREHGPMTSKCTFPMEIFVQLSSTLTIPLLPSSTTKFGRKDNSETSFLPRFFPNLFSLLTLPLFISKSGASLANVPSPTSRAKEHFTSKTFPNHSAHSSLSI